ncbi:hypothetical protein PCA20602_03091 [Pandoraea capi]|uniref:Uncharacterized protein n=1 Tax=Pandoraea capi TaxID=2508286 RepID=A0ABY6W346_9BURK|nr:hypothetical protein [Pandoraea capi]VVE20012.1 hypothetical protein PCA20602_03091 [Pandoraea capi]
MKIDSGITHTLTGRQQTNTGNGRTDIGSFQAVLAEKTQQPGDATGAQQSTRQIDFHDMTRQQMRDWVNGQIRSGQMSLDDSSPFMAMTMKVPVDGSPEIPADRDPERIDFADRARQGIAGALALNDPENAKRLQQALDIMTRLQGQTVGISTRA